MATILKCKMCGGDIEVSQDMTVGKCLYCGSTMTLPKIENEKKARMFNRANDYRLNNEFDKAYEAYKTIIEEDEQEAEAYWGMILSEYGVEYVEDPVSHKRIPTCHRTQIQSIRSSSNYQLALKYADGERKFIYQDEAEVIDKLQRAILSVSSQEEAYDVFICYKETNDATGERTKDNVLAQSIYQELEKNGIRTFFARISLETHLGENYEPYIYSALKSARVMLMVTMSGENCEAVWVKNEWSRFIHFMSEDSSKVLIPIYQGITPYEFPEELSGFQAQDMGKVGAIQDLVYGVQKILGTSRADTRDAALQTLMADKLQREEEELRKEQKKKKIKKTLLIVVPSTLVFALAIGLTSYIIISRRMKNNSLYTTGQYYLAQGDYDEAKQIFMQLGDYEDSINLSTEADYLKAQNLFENADYEGAIEIWNAIVSYKDSEECIKIAEDKIIEPKYLSAIELQTRERKTTKAIVELEKLGDYKDSLELVFQYKKILSDKLIWSAQNSLLGDTINVGHYELDGNENDGEEEIEWIVVKKEDNRVLLVTKYAIDDKEFADNSGDKWDTCSLRNWLNNDFYSTAFLDCEQELIKCVNVENENGKNTSDKIFCLSSDEIDNYHSDYEKRMRKEKSQFYTLNRKDLLYICRRSTDKSKSLSIDCVDWWLRNGKAIDSDGQQKNENKAGVRPAMYLEW